MNKADEICLVSRWKLQDGLDEDMLETLRALAGKVEAAEDDTLVYRIQLPSEFPLDNNAEPLDPPPPSIPLAKQTEVIFVEVYRNVEAFSQHVKSDVFNSFRENTLHYFQKDPNREGWPVTDTVFMRLISGFVQAVT